MSASATPGQVEGAGCTNQPRGRQKLSLLIEARASDAGTAVGWGWESGTGPSAPGQSLRPEQPQQLDPPAEQELERVAKVATLLREQALALLGQPAGSVLVQFSSAHTLEIPADGGGELSRRIESAQLELCPAGGLPAWTRIALLAFGAGVDRPGGTRGGSGGWPDGWLAAVERSCLEWQGDLPASSFPGGDFPAGSFPAWVPPALPESGGDNSAEAKWFVLDLFAAADLLRMQTHCWLRASMSKELLPGSRVAAAGVSVIDPGFAHPAAGADRDALGEKVLPVPAVEAGLWLGGPQGNSGSAVAASWRSRPACQWRSVRLGVGAGCEPWPGEAWVVTRIAHLGGELMGAGYRSSGGRPVARWGPAPLPPSDWWFHSIRAELGVRVAEGTGLPVELAPLLISGV